MFQQGVVTGTLNVPLIRGIAVKNHVNRHSTGCGEPIVEIFIREKYQSNSNDAEESAEVNICSRRGCPLNADIYLYANECENISNCYRYDPK